MKDIPLGSPKPWIACSMRPSALRRPGSSPMAGSGWVGFVTGGPVPMSIPLLLHLSANALIKPLNLGSPGPSKLSAATSSRTTRTFQFPILAPWWNLTSMMFQLPNATRGLPFLYVTLGGGNSRPGMTVIWVEIRMPKLPSTEEAGLMPS